MWAGSGLRDTLSQLPAPVIDRPERGGGLVSSTHCYGIITMTHFILSSIYSMECGEGTLLTLKI